MLEEYPTVRHNGSQHLQNGYHDAVHKPSDRFESAHHGGIATSFFAGLLQTELGHRILELGSSDESVFVNSSKSKEAGALVLSLSTNQEASTVDFELGRLACCRFLALARCKLWWMTPAWGSTAKDVPPETQFLLLELAEGGPYAIMLPLIDSGSFRATLRPPGKQRESSESLTIRIESGDSSTRAKSWAACLLVAASWDPFELVQHSVASAAALSGGGKPLSAKQLPPSLDVFGWCTWDAFYSKISAKGLHEGVRSLCDGGVPPKLVILDDGWQSTEIDAELRGHHMQALDETQVLRSQHSLLQHEAEELAHHAGGTATSIATMPLIEQSSDDEDSDTHLQVQAGRMLNFLKYAFSKGMAEFLFIKFYEGVIEKAEWDSRTVAWFAWCATKGPLKRPLIDFFATSGTFIRRLCDVRANHKFASPSSTAHEKASRPSQLKDVISSLRDAWGVRYFYCWHGLSGYWGGVSTEASSMAELQPEIVYANPTPGVLEIEPAMGWGPASLAGVGIVKQPAKLYEAMHSYLAESGVTGVKVDCQAGVGLVPGPGGGPVSALRCHKALEESVARHFPGNHMINCMGHSTENFYRYTTSAIARCCDDFYPCDPASHTSHIGNAAFNSLFLGALVHPDWDMFQSLHPAAELHAAARAASGSAVYVSDKPGEHDFDLLRRLVLPDGTVLRPKMPGRPTIDVLFSDPMCDGATPLKIWNRNEVGGLVGVFNVQGASWDRSRRRFHIHDENPPPLWAGVSPSDVWKAFDAPPEQSFVMWRGVMQKLQIVRGPQSNIMIKLPPGGSEVVTIIPVMEEAGACFAPIGLKELFNPGAAVLACRLIETGDRPSFLVSIRGFGPFAAYCDPAPVSVEVAQREADFRYDSGSKWMELDIPRDEGCSQHEIKVLL
uniref:galactinol--sucrose galactosyltransferase n=1 Tax=Tetraselmis sp. GSL018 TaxID=582737 RepID=A0A061S594_9CHLO|eukprot:CAMPEP_0177604900 /NCGR_PEP_ID=MMETSP0419_2-20121207/16383_1 /TAXON_ID=582737 /ORGANISM="Tetraselmis sp., Strain GSL018" /LENGTH=895 /DNA_ID=CAMNT_0019098951 /DNA_START=322 /DNA_END=3009 /DNA_ORIENTATION=-